MSAVINKTKCAYCDAEIACEFVPKFDGETFIRECRFCNGVTRSTVKVHMSSRSRSQEFDKAVVASFEKA